MLLTRKPHILSLAFAILFLFGCRVESQAQTIEKIIYNISPVGHCEYEDFGTVSLLGQKVNFVVFKTNAPGFEDTEKIYSDPWTDLPLRVERDISIFMHKENIVEQYFPAANRLLITKFKKGKKTAEYEFKARGPISNAILVPFSLRRLPDLQPGCSFDIRLPQEFKVRLVSLDSVRVPAGKFRAYHFISEPAKFEIWISDDSSRIPIKIKGLGGIPYTLTMKKRISKLDP